MKTTMCICGSLYLFTDEGCLWLLFASQSLSKQQKHFTMHSFPFLTQCKFLHSLSVIKGYILHFTLTSKVIEEFTLLFFTVHFFFKFTIVQSDEGRKRENVSFWGTPTLEICYCSTDNFKQHYNRLINSND